MSPSFIPFEDTPTTCDVYAMRRERLREALKAKGLPGLLVSQAANRYYLSGFELHDPQFNESAGVLAVSASGQDFLLTDPRYEDAAKRLWDPERVFIYSADRFRAMGEFLKGQGLGALGFEPRGLTVFTHSRLSEHLTLTPAEGLVEELRQSKDPEELARMAASCQLNHWVMARVEEMLPSFIGRTEQDLAWAIEKLFRENGAQSLSFPSIVAVDKNAALPHAIPGPEIIREDCLVLVDVGGRLADYCSDQTRTFWAGDKPSDRFRTVQALVRQAQDAALATLKPGLPAAEAYLVAHRFFESQGVAERFTHALGHGIGLETHEAPSLGTTSQAVLAPGMVVTVEPGLYWSDWGGVRWEFMAVITEDGCRVL